MDDAEGVRAALEREGARVVDRLRVLSLERLARPDAAGLTPAARAHGAAQVLADLAADAVGRVRREVPVLGVHGVADQVAVTARDLLTEGDADARSRAVDVLTALRRAL